MLVYIHLNVILSLSHNKGDMSDFHRSSEEVQRWVLLPNGCSFMLKLWWKCPSPGLCGLGPP